MSLPRLEKEFDSAEHKSLGNVTLYGLPVDFEKFLFQPGGFKVTAGEIIALAGDYFGVENESISEGLTKEERQKRFLDAYATLAYCPSENVYELTQEFVKEEEAEKSAIKDGESETDGVDEVTPEETTVALKCTDGHYLTLALSNLDHFGKYALIAYETGYELAMELVLEAANLTDEAAQQAKLKEAYMLYFFACHFLTDLFAAGHMRTPRGDLQARFGAEAGSTLTFIQHNEDGDLGLNVEAASINDDTITQWKAYGDGHLFEKKSTENQTRALNAVQTGINEIYEAFINKKAKPASESRVSKLIPYVTSNNHPPMFKVENGELYCRTPLRGKPVDQYEVLSLLKALEILAIHAEKAVQKTLADRFKSCKEKLEADIKRLEDEKQQQSNKANKQKSGLVNHSIFIAPADLRQRNKKSPHPDSFDIIETNKTNEKAEELSLRICPGSCNIL